MARVSVETLKGRCRIDPATDCWEWTGCVQANGYARVRYKHKTWYAHRLMFYLVQKKLRPGYDVCHHCDNRRCINPKHLFHGTRTANMRDAKEKGRLSTGIRHGVAVRKNRKSKLNMDKANEIRALRANGHSAAKLAAQFDVDPSNIRQIVKNQIWRDLSWNGLT